MICTKLGSSNEFGSGCSVEIFQLNVRCVVFIMVTIPAKASLIRDVQEIIAGIIVSDSVKEFV